MSNQTPYPGPEQSSSNPLVELIPANKRKKVYAFFSLIGLVLGAVVVAVASIGGDVPDWLVIGTAVYTFLGVPFGALAASNVSAP